MIMFTFKMLFLGPGGVLGWVLMRVAVPCGFWVRHSCVCAGWSQDCALLLLHQHAWESFLLPDLTLLLSFHVFTCVYPVSPSWAAGLPLGVWGVAGVVAVQLLKGRVVWELDQSSHPSACDGSPGDLSFLPSPSLPPLGNACVNLSYFPISASTVLPFEGSYWVVVIILLQLPQARTLKPAASSDVKKGFCAQGTSFLW